MTSNSKLNDGQKQRRKDMIAMLPRGSHMGLTNTGVTILLVPAGCVQELYTSIASPDEAKIRRKVGEFYALSRWLDAMGTKIPNATSFDEIAELFGGLIWDDEQSDYKYFYKHE